MMMSRKRHSAQVKAKVALEAIKGQKTTNEIAARYRVHPSQIAQWKKQALDELPQIFSLGCSEQKRSDEALTATLYQEIGHLKVQLDWLKKNRQGKSPD